LDTPISFGKLLAVSPHLDDAVFSCGELIAHHAGALVVTVFSGAPPGFDELTDWDEASGFLSAEEAVSSRKQEDYAALHLLSALPHWLDFYDSQYRDTPLQETVSSALHDVLDKHRPQTILFPAGLFHSDHLLVHRALLAIRGDYPEINWIMYEEALYRRVEGALQQRLAQLLSDGIETTPVSADTREMSHLKQQAVHCYASQLQALERKTPHGYADIFSAERYWQLEPAISRVNEAHTHD
jgi:LmbE family N-acetylglucosaminyl deacetylase